MKSFKRLISVLSLIMVLLMPLSITANSKQIEIFYFNLQANAEDINISLFHDDVFLQNLNQETIEINDYLWYKFSSQDLTLEQTSYKLKIETNTESFTVSFDLLDKNQTESVYTFYLKNQILAADLTELETTVTYATFIDRSHIKFSTNYPVTAENINLYQESKQENILSFTQTGSDYVLRIDDINQTTIKNEYWIKVDSKDGLNSDLYLVRYDELYSSGFFESSFTYDRGDLGANYTKYGTTFKLWAPTLKKAFVNLYYPDKTETLTMVESSYGVFVLEKLGDLKDINYTFSFTRGNKKYEIIDPYAKKINAEQTKAVVVDLENTNPSTFSSLNPPLFSGFYEDAVVYESSVKQLTGEHFYPNYQNTFLGITITDPIFTPIKTGIEHFQELGITHLVLSDLTNTNDSLSVINQSYQYSYGASKDIYDLKTMIEKLNQAGITAILDFNFFNPYIEGLEALMPGYYYEHEAGFLLDESQNNFFNTNHAMVNEYLSSSILYLVKEFKFGGLKLSPLNGINISTLNDLWRKIELLYPNFLIYGQITEETPLITKNKLSPALMDHISFVGIIDEKRFSHQKEDFFTSDTKGLKGYILSESSQTYNLINAFQAFKRLPKTNDMDENAWRQYKMMQLLSYGVPVIIGGEEIGNKGQVINWGLKDENKALFSLYKDLIAFRAQHKSMKFSEHREIKTNVLYAVKDDIIVQRVINKDDIYPDLIIVHYVGDLPYVSYTLPIGLPSMENQNYNTDGDFNWKIVLDNQYVYQKNQVFESESSITLRKNQSVVLHYGLNLANEIANPIPIDPKKPKIKVGLTIVLISLGSVFVIGGAFGIYFIIKSSSKVSIKTK